MLIITIIDLRVHLTGLDAKKIDKCMGDPNADSENHVLKEEQDAQVIASLYYILYDQVLLESF